MTYAGIGSRETPDGVRRDMTLMASLLAKSGWVLRSGGAEGADLSFQAGVPKASLSMLQVFLPWPGYNDLSGGHTIVLDRVRQQDAMNLVSKYHPAWDRCGQGARKLHARSAAIIRGADLRHPVDAVVCWTPNAVPVGGTATGIRMAESVGIPVFNLARFKMDEVLETLGKIRRGLKFRMPKAG